MVECQCLPRLPDVCIFFPRRFEDDRGHFMETFRQSWLINAGIEAEFVQDNQSFSREKGTLRGLHFQVGAHAQAKLVRCVAGRIWDVAVDLRPQSPTCGIWDCCELSADNGNQLFIPQGFAHGFLTLEPASTIAYKCTDYYNGAAERAVHFADPSLAIDWPDVGSEFFLSAKDASAPSFQALHRQAVLGP